VTDGERSGAIRSLRKHWTALSQALKDPLPAKALSLGAGS